MKTAFGIGLIGAIGTVWVATASEDIVGQARVVDGDTLEIRQARIRLWGIDAPEMSQTGGQDARQVLVNMTSGKEVKCYPRGTDKYKRTVAVCWADRTQLNRQMVRSGYAWDYTRYSQGEYAKDQAYAQGFKLGIWAGNPVEPERFRRGH